MRDDRGTQISLSLPTSEGEMVSVSARPGIPQGNEWPMPRLLTVLAKYGLADLEAKHIQAPQLKAQLEYWRDNFGGGARTGQGG